MPDNTAWMPENRKLLLFNAFIVSCALVCSRCGDQEHLQFCLILRYVVTLFPNLSQRLLLTLKTH
jgi:hypothetical protein